MLKQQKKMEQWAKDNALSQAEMEVGEKTGLLQEVASMLRHNPMALMGLIVIILFVLSAVFANLLAPYDYTKVDLKSRLMPPSSAHLLGTDDMGRDILSRLLYGGRISLMIGLVPTFIAMLLGTLLGLVSGFFGRKTDFVIMRLADVVLSFPSLLLAMVIMYTLGASMLNLFIALSVIGWAGTARIVRSQTLSLKQKEFVEAADAIGVNKWTVMFRHILPNCLPSLIVLFTMEIPGSILWEASLSFLGVGAQPPESSWGLMVSQSKQFAFSSPWVTIVPGVAILIVVLAFNFLGDGLRDAIDPYTKA